LPLCHQVVFTVVKAVTVIIVIGLAIISSFFGSSLDRVQEGLRYILLGFHGRLGMGQHHCHSSAWPKEVQRPQGREGGPAAAVSAVTAVAAERPLQKDGH
jgi:hypothetical protein